MSAAEKPVRPGMFCSAPGATTVDEFGIAVSCTRLEGETLAARPRWRRKEDQAGRRRRVSAGAGRRARSGGGRRAPSSATYTGVADISVPTLPFMPVIQLTQPQPPAAPAAPAVVAPGDEPLTEQERLLLDFELRNWISQGAKENAIYQELKMSAIKYWQHINRLLNRRATLREYPQIVSRLDKIRQDSRRW